MQNQETPKIKEKFRTTIGGQALIEGIMMRGPEKDAIVVRKDGQLQVEVKDRKIPKTNNLVELFFKVTFPGKIKRIYRTYEGALNKIKLDNLIWIEKNVIEYHQKNNLIS